MGNKGWNRITRKLHIPSNAGNSLAGGSTARAVIQPAHPQPDLRNHCGGDSHDCSALAGASLRPRLGTSARAQSGRLV
eukprot:6473769-Pyramimonas_sp.AAC.1